MKKINGIEHKKILIDMLNFIHKLCEQNNINYTLIGGSLIGAIRHHGIIPWDDDIDIILMPNEYNNLIKILSSTLDERYKLFNPYSNDDYFYPFAKLVDSRTDLEEHGIMSIKGYGVYLDIFQYHYVSNYKIFRFFHFHKLIFLKRLLWYSVELKKGNDVNKIKLFVKYIVKKIGYKRIKKMYIKTCERRHKPTNFVVSNWPAYGYKKEIQRVSYLDSYKMINFEQIEAMISNNYHDILSITFGDYMKLPPKNEQISNHNIDVYWRSIDER